MSEPVNDTSLIGDPPEPPIRPLGALEFRQYMGRRNLVTAQEAYFSDNNSNYASSTGAMGTNFHASSGVTVTLGSVTNTGWQATATHTSTPRVCTITLGGGATNEGEPLCP